VTESAGEVYDMVTGLTEGEHTVQVVRQSEASFGTSSLRSVEAIDGELLAPPASPGRRIEVFGDSVTTAYGNEGESVSCSFSLETQNFYLSYGALLARGFGAEVASVAFSGRGVVSNYDGQNGETVPQLADRAIAASRNSVFDYSLLEPPELVLINLGTNDYSTDNDPADDEFVEGYVGLLELIRGRYPEAEIVGTVGPLLSGSDLSLARQNIAQAIAQLADAGDTKVHAVEIESDNPSPGCDYHPDLGTHAAMARELGGLLSTIVGWDYSDPSDISAGGAGPK
jgi:lysophospholipase L1-like esterase